MNISSYNKTNSIRYGLKENNNKKKSGEFFLQKDNLSFTGNKIEIVTIANADIIVNELNKLCGDNYFSKLLAKAGLNIEEINKSKFIQYVNPTVTHDIKRTAISLVNVFITGFRKAHKLITNNDIKGKNKLSAAMLRISEDVERNKYFDKVTEIAEALVKGRKNLGNLANSDKTQEIADGVLDKLLKNITKNNKPYLTRDERSMNRLATSFVSAIFSANDYHNISMLQKNDTEEAKASAKDRFQQDMIRAGISAGLSYFTLGALDRYSKNSLLLNASVIALSAFISEITTRIIKHKSLVPLTPAKAKEIANKRKGVEGIEQYNKQTAQTQNKPATSTYKSDFSKNKEIFKNFTNTRGEFDSLNELSKQNIRNLNKASIQTDTNKKDNKNNKILKVAIGAIIISNIIYLVKSLKKGDLKNSLNGIKYTLFKKDSDKLNKLKEQIKNPDNTSINKKIKEKIQSNKTIEKIKGKIQDNKTIEKIKNSRKSFLYETYSSDELISKLEAIKATDKGKEIEDVINAYINKIGPDEIKELKVKKDRILLNALKGAFSKFYNTIYQICSMPARLVEFGLGKATELNESYSNWLKVHGISTGNKDIDDYKKEIEALAKLCLNKGQSPISKKLNEKLEDLVDIDRIPNVIKKLANNKLSSNRKTDEQLAGIIQDRIRQLGFELETGQLANYSRTLVTMISSFFFVNDYYNESLINSEGTDIEAAKVKRNEKIGHKIINYFSNGLFMNIFNSVFEGPLNSSVAKATLVAAATEVTNESTIRAFTCEPRVPLKSKEEIIEYEQKKLNRKGLAGAWSRFFRKITGKKTLTQKTAS